MLRVCPKLCEFLPTMSLPVYRNAHVRPSKKKNTFLVRISIKKESGRAVFFVIYYFLLHAFFKHYYLPQGYVGALRSNINKTKHQILIKHKFV